jgi:hypothetical protein
MRVVGTLAFLGFWSVSAAAGQVFMAAVTHHEGNYLVEVDVLVDVPEPTARALLTDYNHLGRINPAIEISEVLLERKPGDYRVKTVTKACVWFYCKRIHQIQDVIEAHDGSITAVVIPELSDFKQGYARLNIWQEPGGSRIRIRSEVEPDFWIPPLIGPWLIKRKLRSEALETVQNLERVAHQAPMSHNTPAKK